MPRVDWIYDDRDGLFHMDITYDMRTGAVCVSGFPIYDKVHPSALKLTTVSFHMQESVEDPFAIYSWDIT